MAQSGSAFGWGPKGRRFKSCLPDQTIPLAPLWPIHPRYTSSALSRLLDVGRGECYDQHMNGILLWIIAIVAVIWIFGSKEGPSRNF